MLVVDDAAATEAANDWSVAGALWLAVLAEVDAVWFVVDCRPSPSVP